MVGDQSTQATAGLSLRAIQNIFPRKMTESKVVAW